MQFKRVVIVGFLILSLFAVWDVTRPAPGGFAGIVTREYVRLDGERVRFPVREPDYAEERALEPVTGVRALAIESVSGILELVPSETGAVTASYTVLLWADGNPARLAETGAAIARQVTATWVREGDSARLTVNRPAQLPAGVQAMRVAVRVAVPDGVAVTARHTGAALVEGLTGAVRLEHRSGDVVVRRVAGPVDITSGFAVIDVLGVEGALNAQLLGGDLKVRDVTGTVQGRVRMGALELARVAGDVTFTVDRGRARVENVGGNLHLNTSYGQVEIARVAGDIRLEHSFGEADVRDVTRAADISVRFGELEVALSGEGGWNVEAMAEMGSLETDLPLRREASELRTVVSGVIGDGAHDVRLQVHQGALRLTRR